MNTNYLTNIALFSFVWLMISTTPVFADQYEGKKILFINSYHQGYEWSDGVQRGAENILNETNATLEIFYMDSKRKRDENEIQTSAQKAIEKIESFKPDLVIVADDPAAKYVVEPIYKQKTSLPFIFTAVNWDASVYGFPAENVTGMIEVSLIESIVRNLKPYSKGEKIGLLSIDALSSRVNVDNFERVLNKSFDKKYYVQSFEEWKQSYLKLQNEVDMLILENPKGITDWDNELGKQFVEENSSIPSGTTHVWLAPYALLTIAKIPEEQGEWAAENALKILSGTNKLTDIKVVSNKKGQLFINMLLAKKQNIIFGIDLIKTATILQ